MFNINLEQCLMKIIVRGKEFVLVEIKTEQKIMIYWWLVELPMWLTDGFLLEFFWKVEGAGCIHVNSRVAHVWLQCRIVGGGGVFRTLGNSESLENFKFL